MILSGGASLRSQVGKVFHHGLCGHKALLILGCLISFIILFSAYESGILQTLQYPRSTFDSVWVMGGILGISNSMLF